MKRIMLFVISIFLFQIVSSQISVAEFADGNSINEDFSEVLSSIIEESELSINPYSRGKSNYTFNDKLENGHNKDINLFYYEVISSGRLDSNSLFMMQDPKPGFDILPYIKAGAIGFGFGVFIGLIQLVINPDAEGLIVNNTITDWGIISAILFEIDFIFFNTLPLDFLK